MVGGKCVKRIPSGRRQAQSVDLNQPAYKQEQNFQLLLLLNQPVATSKKENNGGKRKEHRDHVLPGNK
jgi:hypothetical protein